MYRTVYDLNRAELEELKDSFFWSDEVDDEILEGYSCPYEIPDDIIYSHFDGIGFVDEDFICNLN